MGGGDLAVMSFAFIPYHLRYFKNRPANTNPWKSGKYSIYFITTIVDDKLYSLVKISPEDSNILIESPSTKK